MTGYSERDAARDTGTSEREATAAHHQARIDGKVHSETPDDRPTPQNRADARRLERKIIERGRNRPPDEREDRTER